MSTTTQNHPLAFTILLECRLLPGIHRFTLPQTSTVADLLERIMAQLLASEAADQARAMLEYYRPTLELTTPGESKTLTPEDSLQQAGLFDGAICRISALPRKEKQMFCQWCQ